MNKPRMLQDYGYTLSLHHDGEDPQQGFGYCDIGGPVPVFAVGREALEKKAAEWTQHFGRPYQVTVLEAPQ